MATQLTNAGDFVDANPNNPQQNSGGFADSLGVFGQQVAGYALGVAAKSIGAQQQATQAAAGADTTAAKAQQSNNWGTMAMILVGIILGAFLIKKVLK